MSLKPYITREIVVRTCDDCPFLYHQQSGLGGGSFCQHPGGNHLRGVDTGEKGERRRIKGCPLRTQHVLIRTPARGSK